MHTETDTRKPKQSRWFGALLYGPTVWPACLVARTELLCVLPTKRGLPACCAASPAFATFVQPRCRSNDFVAAYSLKFFNSRYIVLIIAVVQHLHTRHLPRKHAALSSSCALHGLPSFSVTPNSRVWPLCSDRQIRLH